MSGRWRAIGGDKPPGEHLVGDDFFGVGVAGGEDSACDDIIVARLRELGLRRVRVDFAAASRSTFQERLLRRLIDEKFKICLHLVQSRSEAESLPGNAQAGRDWRLFVAETLAAYGHEVDLVEIGSTCNRRKWSGYTLPGYLHAWRIACEAASAHNCALAAPNVTDFEPVYNIALLSRMKQLGLLPAVHTDNLFVERASEPESYDHKIAGRIFAGVFRFNLVRKAMTLKDIALSFAVPKTICPHVSWSLRRIARFLGETEEKQADYLARYCCLAAASGALENVYWGPLIGQREGLIDDGTAEFPEIPHVTFYGEARGNPAGYRVRPAYFAFKAVNRLLSGTAYSRKIPSEYGLEIHEFRAKSGLLHVAWTMNGRCALTGDCYAKEALKRARFYSRAGVPLDEPPAMISESPVYIFWPGPGFSENRAPAPAMTGKPRVLQHIRFANTAGRKYDFIARDNLEGVCRHDYAGKILDIIAPPTADAKAKILRDARNRVWRALPGGDTNENVIVKQFRPLPLIRRFLSGHKGDKALRSWNGAQELLRRGIATPGPIAFFHGSKAPLARAGWYVCEDFAESFSVRKAFTAFSETYHARGNNGAEFEGLQDGEFYDQLALFLRTIHDRGVYFRDLSAGNLLFRIQPGRDIAFALIDTARAVFCYKSIGLRARLCDLMRMCHPLCWKGRRMFLARYMASFGRDYRFWMNIPFYYYDLKHFVKGMLRKKIIKKQPGRE
ncbi:MAG: hypothetical protein PHP98_05905 [Kiritimatiellae bacterium]|nr:hypothetical protein [Kiritimatiellia bacterium]